MSCEHDYLEHKSNKFICSNCDKQISEETYYLRAVLFLLQESKKENRTNREQDLQHSFENFTINVFLYFLVTTSLLTSMFLLAVQTLGGSAILAIKVISITIAVSYIIIFYWLIKRKPP